MSRIIKFRAWDKARGAWLNITDTYAQVENQARWNPEVGEFYVLSQFTGLKDRTGKEIYEGDKCSVTLSTGRKVNAFVAFVDGCFELQFVSPIENGRYNYMDYLKCHTVNLAVEVIGNIYENPELIKEGK